MGTGWHSNPAAVVEQHPRRGARDVILSLRTHGKDLKQVDTQAMSFNKPSLPARVADHGRGATSRRWPRRSKPGMVIAAAVMPVLMSGCGQGSEGVSRSADASARPSTDNQSDEPKISDSPTQTAPGASADESMGVDAVQWPGDLANAKKLFARMPNELAGMPGRQPKFYGPSAGIVYGPMQDGAMAWVMGTDKQVKDPTSVLAVMFGLGLACKKGTYAGTAPPSRWGGGPDMDREHQYDPGKGAWWFSCTIDGAEGDPQYTGHAVGWVSGDLGWLTTSPDKKTARALTKALIAAR